MEVEGDSTSSTEPMVGVTSSNSNINPVHNWYKVHVSNQVEEKMTERVGHSLIYSLKTQTVYLLCGGNHGGDIKEIWVFPTISSGAPFHGSIHEQLSMEVPGLYEFACVYNSGHHDGEDNDNEDHEKIWIFGGANSMENQNDVYAIDLKDETFTTVFNGKKHGGGSGGGGGGGGGGTMAEIPAPRTQGNNSCFLRLHGQEYLAVFGGGQRGEIAIPDVDLYLFSIQNKTWKKVDIIGVKPSPSQGHAMTSIGTKIFLHGGMDNFVFSANLYVMDLHFDQPIWLKIEPPLSGPIPSPRAAHGMVAYNNCLYLCCGVGNEGAVTDVWKFDTENVKWQCLQQSPAASTETESTSTPSPRTDFATTLVQLGPTPALLIHGGMNTTGKLFTDFWLFPLAN